VAATPAADIRSVWLATNLGNEYESVPILVQLGPSNVGRTSVLLFVRTRRCFRGRVLPVTSADNGSDGREGTGGLNDELATKLPRSSPSSFHLSNRMLGIIGAFLVIFVAIAVWQGLATPPADNPGGLVGITNKPAPPINLVSLTDSSKKISIDSFRGTPLVVNFWASWCIPCRVEMPVLESAFRAEHGKVLFLGIDSNDIGNAARAFLVRVGVSYPTVFDPNGTAAIAYGLFGLPTTVFISSTGEIVGRHIGQLTSKSLRAALKEAFHE
jgi:cytochrome c biogenesis protein CcmG/thiol:disulfide interchange protein DsbE